MPDQTYQNRRPLDRTATWQPSVVSNVVRSRRPDRLVAHRSALTILKPPKSAFAAYVTLNVPGRDQHPRHVHLATVFATVLGEPRPLGRSGPENRRNLVQMIEVLPEGITVDELTPDMQKRPRPSYAKLWRPARCSEFSHDRSGRCELGMGEP